MKITRLATASALAFLLGSTAVMAQANSPVGNNVSEGLLSPSQAEKLAPDDAKPSTPANVPTGIEAPAASKTPGERAHDKYGQKIPNTAKTAPSGYQTGQADKTPGEQSQQQYKN